MVIKRSYAAFLWPYFVKIVEWIFERKSPYCAKAHLPTHLVDAVLMKAQCA